MHECIHEFGWNKDCGADVRSGGVSVLLSSKKHNIKHPPFKDLVGCSADLSQIVLRDYVISDDERFFDDLTFFLSLDGGESWSPTKAPEMFLDGYVCSFFSGDVLFNWFLTEGELKKQAVRCPLIV